MTDLSPRPVVAPSPRRRRLMPMLLIAAVLIAGGVIVTQFLTSAVDYYCNVDEIGSRSGCDTERRLRVQGTVDEGSVIADRGVTTFTISFNESTLDVRYDGDPGGIFKECIPVVVHGRIEGETFLGDRVEVKHSNEYVAVNSDRITEAEYEGCAPGAA